MAVKGRNTKLRQPFAFIAIYCWLCWPTGQGRTLEDAIYLISLFRFYFIAFILVIAPMFIENENHICEVVKNTF